MELYQFRPDHFELFLSVAIAHFLALLSPGPDFIIIVKSSLKNRYSAIGVAAGIASANAVYIALCIFGVGVLLAQSVTLMLIIKLSGAGFLLYLASQAFRAKKTDYVFFSAIEASNSTRQSGFIAEFTVGFFSGILNPKNLLFYLSLFSLVLTHDVSLSTKTALGIWMTTVVFAWDVIIVLLISHPGISKRFTNLAFYIDKFSAIALASIGAAILHASLLEAMQLRLS